MSETSDAGTQQCPGCEQTGKGNGNGISFVCQNRDCRVAAFNYEAVNQ